MLSKNVNNKNWNRIFYFKIQQAPSELLLPSAKKLAQTKVNSQVTTEFDILLNSKSKGSRPLSINSL